MVECTEDGCVEIQYCKGLCKSHYHKEYNRLNRERRSAAAKARYEKKKEELLEQMRQRYRADPEARKAQVRKWREDHPNQYQETNRAYREANLEKLHEYDAQPERMAKKAERKRDIYEEIKLEALLIYGDGTCAHCSYEPEDIFELELDHVNDDGAAHRREITGKPRGRSFQFYRALKDLGWPKNPPLQTLCGRCHKKKTIAWQRSKKKVRSN